MKNLNFKFLSISSVALCVSAFQFFTCVKPCENKVIAVFEKARGIEEGAKVQSNGIEIGKVTKVDLGANGKVLMELCIDPKYKIPKNSVCAIATPSLFGDKVIEVTYSEEQTFCANNDTIQGQKQSSLGDIFKSVIETAVDSMAANMNDSLDDAFKQLDSALKEK
jgi:phospholipid/cholesterol/gamma-HCH transport system substrate-binding protein